MKKNGMFVPITVDHLARVEGKGGVEIFMGDNEVKEVRLNIFEGPRFFESITKGKRVEEALSIYPRVCSYCSAAHKLTAIEAAEKAVGFMPRDEIKWLREVLYIGDIIESHALHLYLLVLPDYLGFSGAFTPRMLNTYKKEIETALELKKLGNFILDVLGSRSIHQENAVLGGFGKLPEKEIMEEMLEKLKKATVQAEYTFYLFSRLDQYDEVEGPIIHVSSIPYDGKYGLFGDGIKVSDGTEIKCEDYQKFFVEKVVDYSFAKFCYYNGMTPFMTGALSRVVNFGNTLSGKARELYENNRELFNPRNPFANNLSQALEIVYFIEKAIDHIEKLLEVWPVVPKDEVEINDGYGVSVTEAPRGILVYALSIKDGKIAGADIITPTTFNLAKMEEHVRMMVEKHLKDEEEKIKLLSEMVVRAYDPCISCSVHVTKLKSK